MKKVLVFGTFDLLHPGHLCFLKEAKGHGEVTVALTPDSLLPVYKGRKAINNFDIRKKRLEALRFVHEVISADAVPNSYAILARVRPKIIVLGYDQNFLMQPLSLRIKELNSACSIIVARSYRSTLYRSSLFSQATIPTKSELHSSRQPL